MLLGITQGLIVYFFQKTSHKVIYGKENLISRYQKAVIDLMALYIVVGFDKLSFSVLQPFD